MTSEKIFEALCNCRNPDCDGGMAPVQLEKNGVKITEIEDNGQDVISHTEYVGDDGGKVVEIITSYDHSRTFENRPDSNHFDITLYNPNGSTKPVRYTTWDSM